jgi:outer membrane protein assembly factor BamB
MNDNATCNGVRPNFRFRAPLIVFASVALLVSSRCSQSRAESGIAITPAKPSGGRTVEPASADEQPGESGLPVYAHQTTFETTAGSSIYMADRDLALKFREVRRFVEKNELTTALGHLQAILDAKSDGFYADRDDRGAVRRSLKFSAERLLSSIVQRDRELYERLYGAPAKHLLDKSIAAGDLGGLQHVSRRYFYTRAGQDATYRLAAHYLDRDEPLMAAICFQRLRNVRQVDSRRRTMMALQLAVSQVRAKMPQAARATLDELRVEGKLDGFQVGDRTLAPFDAGRDSLDWLAEHFPIPRERGVALQSALLVAQNERHAGAPSAEPRDTRWTLPTFGKAREAAAPIDDSASAAFDALFANETSATSPSGMETPRPMPIVVNDTVVYRTPGNVAAVDLKTGRPLWQSELDKNADELLLAGKRPPSGKAPVSLRHLVEQRSWRDSTYGTFSSDGQRVYCIDVGLARFHKNDRKKRFVYPTGANRLVARNVRTGEIAWSIDGADSGWSASGKKLVWLGAPQVVGNNLLLLADDDRRVVLVSLNAETGNLRWHQPLAMAGCDIASDYYRRVGGLTPVSAGGLVVCPTGTGSLVALDYESRQLLWAYTPGDSDESNQTDHETRMAQLHRRETSGTDWFDTRVFIIGDMVLGRPRGSDSLHCLDLASGKLNWKQPCDAYSYVAGIADGRVALVGKNAACAFDLQTGSSAWNQPLKVLHATGRGLICQGTLYIPKSARELTAIRMSTGQVLPRHTLKGQQGLGNLVQSGDLMVWQNVRSIGAFPFVPAQTQDVAETDLPVITPGLPGVR